MAVLPIVRSKENKSALAGCTVKAAQTATITINMVDFNDCIEYGIYGVIVNVAFQRRG